MKRIVLILMLACAVCTLVSAQTEDIYVSARGNDDNIGDSESAPLKTLSHALLMANLYAILEWDVRIIVIGTLNVASEGSREDGEVFHVYNVTERQILITGKPGATGSERAVLSGRGSDALTVHVDGAIRFENIEISGGEGELGYGIVIYGDGSNVTLGTGAVVRGNSGGGMSILDGACTIDGGEVRDNNYTGVLVAEKCVLTMRSGTIRDNRSPTNSGGVFVANGGRFTMSGGTITGNSAAWAGGGVRVMAGGRFDQTGGTISNNTATQGSNPNIYREQGSLGSNLTPGSSGSASSGSSGSSSSGSSSSGSSSSGSSSSGSSSSRSSSSSSGFGWDIPVNFGFYLQGLNINTVSLGLRLQLGVEFNFGSAVSLALLGEAGGGMGIPYLLEYNYGAMAELYFLNKTFGLGFGIGAHHALFPVLSDLFGGSSSSIPRELMAGSNYIRLALIFRNDNKLSLYAQLYNSGSANGKWGIGISSMF